MADSSEQAVRNVVQQYVDGTYKGDAAALRACFHAQAVMNGYLQDQLLLGSPEPFFENIESQPPMVETDAPYSAEITQVDVTGNVASVTLRETGYASTIAFTNYFHLIKQQDEWKILSKTFTTE
jgi:hypothetical protein